MTVTGTAVDFEILLAQGTIDEDTDFEVLTPEEMRSMLSAERTALIMRKTYDAFWRGHALGKLDAVPAEAPKPSPFRRLLRSFGRRRFTSFSALV